jgi:parvulin-like peptidyl-prolyl isomerase
MRRSAAIALIANFALLAACGSGSGGGVAVTVDGTDITIAQVEEMTVSESGTVPADQFNVSLYNAIVETVVLAAAKTEFGYEASPTEIEAKKAELTELFDGQGMTVEEALATEQIPLSRFDALATQHVVTQKLLDHFIAGEEPITNEEAQIGLEAQLGTLSEVCSRHILVASEAEAIAAKDRITNGEDFQEVAKELGTDGTAPNGGDLGCQAPAAFVQEFAAAVLEAPIGEVFGPVQTEYGYHLILVESRTVPTLQDVKDAAVEARAQGAMQTWMGEALTKATVVVNERFGTWVTSPYPQILPPQS